MSYQGGHRELVSARLFALLVSVVSLACSSDSADPAAGAGGSSSAGKGGSEPSASAGNASQAGAAPAGGRAGASGAGEGGAGGVPAAGAPNGGAAPVIAAGVRWVGRVDVSDPAAVRFAWTGTGFVGTFEGPSVSVRLRTEGGGEIYFQPVVDGVPGERFAVGSDERTVELAAGLAAGPHRIELYRETEGKGFGVSVFSGFGAGAPGTPPPASGRLIEVIGDSISAGYGNLGLEQHPNYGPDPNGGCGFTTETESGYAAYGQVAARAVDADASVLAGSGWGVYSDRVGNTDNVMPALFSNTLGERPAPAWSFAAQPQAVVINLGTNDSVAGNLTAGEFKPAYAAFVETVRERYPGALILCAVGTLMGDAERAMAIPLLEAIIEERAAAGDSNVKLLDLGTQDVLQGTGCDWHPSAAENQRMAELLVAELEASLGW